jgi:glycerol-3-phosphate dehydrogenase
MTEAEVQYLCDAVNQYLKKPLSPKDAIWRYSGVRPLLDDGSDNASNVTRDYTLLLDVPEQDELIAPMLTVLGGKLTTYRKLAEHAMEKLAEVFPNQINLQQHWTHLEPLPGGDIPSGWAGFLVWQKQLFDQYSELDLQWLNHFSRRYGTLSADILGDAQSMHDLGQHFGGGLYEVEALYLMHHEWAWQADDILWRRTKFGLHMTAEQRADFTSWYEQARAQEQQWFKWRS